MVEGEGGRERKGGEIDRKADRMTDTHTLYPLNSLSRQCPSDHTTASFLLHCTLRYGTVLFCVIRVCILWVAGRSSEIHVHWGSEGLSCVA